MYDLMLERTQINLTKAQHQQLKNESEETGLSISALIRLIVNKHLKEAE